MGTTCLRADFPATKPRAFNLTLRNHRTHNRSRTHGGIVLDLSSCGEGRDWRLPLFDPFVKLLGGDAARRALLDEAALRPGHRVLDVGCGTGTLATLATLIKQLHPEVEVVGFDPDPKALARARRKAARGG